HPAAGRGSQMPRHFHGNGATCLTERTAYLVLRTSDVKASAPITPPAIIEKSDLKSRGRPPNFSWHGVSVHQPVGPPRWQPRPLLEAIFASGAPRTPSSVARSQTAATRGSAVSPAGGPLP